jgi:hypothetical protein
MPQACGERLAVHTTRMGKSPVLFMTAILLGGCTAVRPWQREYLAKPCMQTRFGEDVLAAEYRAKVIESTTGGGLPGEAPGGGCGCTQ